MKITRITPIPLTAAYVRPHTGPDHPSNGVRNCVWLKVETESELVGWGEAYCGCYATEVTVAALHRLARSVEGRDVTELESILERMRFSNRYWAMNGIGAQCTSAFEAALWDIKARSEDVPLWKLLGEDEPHPVLLYASAGDSMATPQQILDEARRYRALGYRAYKMRCGGRLADGVELSFDVERVAAAREGLGPGNHLFVDVAVPQKYPVWEAGRAEEYLAALHPYDVGFIEEPAMTYDVAHYARLQSLNLMPVAGGESFTSPAEFEPFFQANAYGVAQPDAAVVGGPASCVQVCRRAAECDVPVAIHAWSAGVGVAQNLHAAWSVPCVLAMEWPQSEHPLFDEPLKDAWTFRDGHAHPTGAVGLGCTIHDELLTRCRYVPNSERDY